MSELEGTLAISCKFGQSSGLVKRETEAQREGTARMARVVMHAFPTLSHSSFPLAAELKLHIAGEIWFGYLKIHRLPDLVIFWTFPRR